MLKNNEDKMQVIVVANWIEELRARTFAWADAVAGAVFAGS